jgi:UDP-galactopyranose mutase
VEYLYNNIEIICGRNRRNNKEIDDFGWSPKGTSLKKGPRAAWDTAISAYPISIDGYNAYFDAATNGINLLLNTNIEKFDIQNKQVQINGEKLRFDIIVNTISPDIIFDFCFGELPYMGRDITTIVLPVEYALPKNVYFTYYASGEKYTRITEYKKFTNYKSDSTLLTLEIPSSNGRHYPMPFKIEYERADKYFNLMPSDVYTIGRAGSYRYSVDIDDCIEQAKQVADMVKG